MDKKQISLQVYSARNFKPYENTLYYALGAINAAIWLSKKKKGFFDMSDVLGIS